jgi:hypothetical protein
MVIRLQENSKPLILFSLALSRFFQCPPAAPLEGLEGSLRNLPKRACSLSTTLASAKR